MSSEEEPSEFYYQDGSPIFGKCSSGSAGAAAYKESWISEQFIDPSVLVSSASHDVPLTSSIGNDRNVDTTIPLIPLQDDSLEHLCGTLTPSLFCPDSSSFSGIPLDTIHDVISAFDSSPVACPFFGMASQATPPSLTMSPESIICYYNKCQKEFSDHVSLRSVSGYIPN